MKRLCRLGHRSVERSAGVTYSDETAYQALYAIREVAIEFVIKEITAQARPMLSVNAVNALLRAGLESNAMTTPRAIVRK